MKDNKATGVFTPSPHPQKINTPSLHHSFWKNFTWCENYWREDKSNELKTWYKRDDLSSQEYEREKKVFSKKKNYSIGKWDKIDQYYGGKFKWGTFW